MLNQKMRFEKGDNDTVVDTHGELINGVEYINNDLDDIGENIAKYLYSILGKYRLSHRPLDTISDPNDTDKTATEIKSSRQRSYQFVSDTQKALQNALNDYFDAYALYAGLYGIDSSTDYTISYTWDDSLVIDSDTEKMIDMQLVSAGVMPKYEFRMKWNGEDEETAKKMIQAAKDESGSGTESNTNPFGFDGGNGSA